MKIDRENLPIDYLIKSALSGDSRTFLAAVREKRIAQEAAERSRVEAEQKAKREQSVQALGDREH